MESWPPFVAPENADHPKSLFMTLHIFGPTNLICLLFLLISFNQEPACQYGVKFKLLLRQMCTTLEQGKAFKLTLTEWWGPGSMHI